MRCPRLLVSVCVVCVLLATAACSRESERAPLPEPPATPPIGATIEDPATSAEDVPTPSGERDAGASEAAPGPSDEEIEAQAAALRSPRDVLEVFLTTREPRLRHALLAPAARARITPAGLQTFLTDTPGLLDLPLPLLPTGYEIEEVETPATTTARFLVRARGSFPPRSRLTAYYALRAEPEDGAPRILWDRRLVGLAQVALARGQYERAEELAREILAWSPACADCEQILFWSRSRRIGGKEAWSRAAPHARRAVELEPEIASHHNALGVYYRNQRMYQSAERSLKRALALDPDSPAAGNFALLLERQMRKDEALKLASEYVERHPAELWGHLTRCRLLKRLDRYEDAVQACRTALDLRQPTDELAHVDAAHYLLAYALYHLGKPEEARPEIDKAIEYRPSYWLYLDLRDRIGR